jgi:hypothetical protein
MSHEAINAIKKIMTIFQASEGGIKEKETKKVTFQKTLEL